MVVDWDEETILLLPLAFDASNSSEFLNFNELEPEGNPM